VSTGLIFMSVNGLPTSNVPVTSLREVFWVILHSGVLSVSGSGFSIR